MATSPELKNIEVGNALEDKESSLIRDLKVDAFDVDANKDNINEMKDILKTTKINVITSVKNATTETTEQKTLSEIADSFITYVEKKSKGWGLQLIEANKSTAPEWIKYIIDNPKNNDLAYFIQKLSGLIEYQTAKAYTENELNAVEVKVDKTFGNQTKNALVGLKNWIIDSTENKTFISKDFLKWIVSSVTSQTEADINKALEVYHVTYNKSDDKFSIVNWYDRIDAYGNNLATKKIWTGTTNKETQTTETPTTENVGGIKIEDIKDKDVADLIKTYPKYFDLSKFNQETIANLGSLLLDWNKRETFFSMISLSSKFWGDNNFKLWAEEIGLLINAMDEDYMDYSDVSNVFHTYNNRSSDEENDFVGMKVVNGKKTLVKHGNIWQTPVFEVDGTAKWFIWWIVWDDYRFDSIETFFIRLKNERKIPDEENEGTIDTYTTRFDPTIDNDTLKQTIGAIEKDDEKKRTFISLLNLNDTFWGDYKLTLEDISAFKKWIAKDTFDYETGSDTIFHEYTDDPENDYKTVKDWKIVEIWDQWSTRVFEVDGTGTIDDERFDSVAAFFARLRKEVK